MFLIIQGDGFTDPEQIGDGNDGMKYLYWSIYIVGETRVNCDAFLK